MKDISYPNNSLTIDLSEEQHLDDR